MAKLPSMIPRLKYIWWNWFANEVKRHPKAITRPPITAVKRVDFFRQIPIVMGDKKSETDIHNDPNQTEMQIKKTFLKVHVPTTIEL